MRKKKVENKEENELKKEYKDSIPNDIKVLFGKFYVYSLVLIIFFGIIYPFLLIDNISTISSIIILIVLFIFYSYIVYDVFKKRKNFNSSIFLILILLVISSFIFSVYRVFVY